MSRPLIATVNSSSRFWTSSGSIISANRGQVYASTGENTL